MYAYFKMLKEEASIDPTEYSIKDLTIELAKRAGYHRANYTFDNGSVRERTMYDRGFDSVLTAKWIMFYKPLFCGKLATHPEFGDGAVDIINSTFLITMNCLQLDKVVDDDVVNRYVNMALSGRIKNFLIEKGSIRRLNEYQNGEKLNMRLNKSVLNQSVSLDESLLTEDNDAYSDLPSDLVMELYWKLEGNPYGSKLLETMLYANQKVRLSCINKYMHLEPYEQTEETKRYIAEAYAIIKDTLRKHIDNSYMFDFGHANDEEVGFVDEVEDESV